MISKYHGKHYYIELKTLRQVREANKIIEAEESLADEKFFCERTKRGYVIYSESKVETFIKTPKYSAWNRARRNIYKMMKELI